MYCGDQGCNRLSKNNKHTFNRIGVFGCKRCSKASIPNFNLISLKQFIKSSTILFLVLESQIFYHFQLFVEFYIYIFYNLIFSSLELFLLLLVLHLFLLCLWDVCCTYHCYTHISCPQTSHIICPIASIKNSFAR